MENEIFHIPDWVITAVATAVILAATVALYLRIKEENEATKEKKVWVCSKFSST